MTTSLLGTASARGRLGWPASPRRRRVGVARNRWLRRRSPVGVTTPEDPRRARCAGQRGWEGTQRTPRGLLQLCRRTSGSDAGTDPREVVLRVHALVGQLQVVLPVAPRTRHGPLGLESAAVAGDGEDHALG